VRRLFVDTPPVIYHIENHPRYCSLTRVIFRAVRDGAIEAVTSPVTLAECLVHPFRAGNEELVARFRQAITASRNVVYVGIDAVAESAARIRARHRLTLADAFQVAAALRAGCDALLTNDRGYERIGELTVIVLDDMEP
jgi:predicted nucleic acid-binding protein